jgi:rieske iron-sulfur protein
MQKHGPHRSCYRRRTIFGLALTPWLVRAVRAEDSAAMPPQPEDRLVFFAGAKKGQVVKVDDLVVDGPQVQAYPATPDGIVRNQSRLNLLIVARFDPSALAEATRMRAADGVVAYSAVCTHQGCPVNMWSKDRNAFVCSCHASVFDPRKGAEVIGGPAPRPLPALGLKVAEGAVWSPQPLMRALERRSNDGLSAREAVVNTMESTEYEEELGPRSISRA